MWKPQLLLLGFLNVNCDILVKQALSFTQNSGIINKLCDDGLIMVSNQTSSLQCAKLCALNDNCVSFFVNRDGDCQLNSVIIYDTTPCASSHNTLCYVSKKFVVKGTTEDPTAEGQTSKYIDTTLKMTTDVAITEGQTSKHIHTTLKIDTEDATTEGQTSSYFDTSLKITTGDGTSKVQTSKYIDTPLKITTEYATTKGHTSNRIDTTLKMTTGDISTLAVECDIEWVMLGTGCYQFTLGGTRQIWLDAKDLCSLNGGYLAIIETAEENVLIKDHIAAIGPTNDYFIGGSDLATEGEFIWKHTGLPVNLPGSNLFHDWRTISLITGTETNIVLCLDIKLVLIGTMLSVLILDILFVKSIQYTSSTYAT